LTAVNAVFLISSSMKFLEGGFVPLSVGVAVFLIMVTWRWGRKATFAAYAARSTLTMQEVIDLHRSSTNFLNVTRSSWRPCRYITHPIGLLRSSGCYGSAMASSHAI